MIDTVIELSDALFQRQLLNKDNPNYGAIR